MVMVEIRIPEGFINPFVQEVEQFKGTGNIGEVYIAGDWNNWGDSPERAGCINPQKTDRMKKEGNEYVAYLNIKPGVYYFKPVVVKAKSYNDGMASCIWIDHPGEGKVKYKKAKKHGNWTIATKKATPSKTENKKDSAIEQGFTVEMAKTNYKGRRRNYLTEMFRSQMRGLAKIMPREIVEYFKSQESRVVSRALNMEIPDNNIPFLPVPSFYWLSLISLSSILRGMIHSEKDKNFMIRPQNIIDETPVFEEPYFMFNVVAKVNPEAPKGKEVKKQIEEEGCYPLTLREGIILSLYNLRPSVSNNYKIICLSSFHRITKRIPEIGFSKKDGDFYVSFASQNTFGSSFAFPSCAFRG